MFQSIKNFYDVSKAIYSAMFTFTRLISRPSKDGKIKLKPLFEHGENNPSNGYRYDIQVGKEIAQGIIRRRKKDNARILKEIAKQGRYGHVIKRDNKGKVINLIEGTQYFNGFMGITRGVTTNGYHLGKRSVYIQRPYSLRHFWALAQ